MIRPAMICAAFLAVFALSPAPAISTPAKAGDDGSIMEDADRAKLLLNGYRRYHSVCNHCHGPDGLGSSFGPSLIDEPPHSERFRTSVRNGVRGAKGVMKGYAENADIMKHLDAIYAYIEARSTGQLGRGRPK